MVTPLSFTMWFMSWSRALVGRDSLRSLENQLRRPKMVPFFSLPLSSLFSVIVDFLIFRCLTPCVLVSLAEVKEQFSSFQKGLEAVKSEITYQCRSPDHDYDFRVREMKTLVEECGPELEDLAEELDQASNGLTCSWFLVLGSWFFFFFFFHTPTHVPQ
jgi:hypothetical protein